MFEFASVTAILPWIVPLLNYLSVGLFPSDSVQFFRKTVSESVKSMSQVPLALQVSFFSFWANIHLAFIKTITSIKRVLYLTVCTDIQLLKFLRSCSYIQGSQLLLVFHPYYQKCQLPAMFQSLKRILKLIFFVLCFLSFYPELETYVCHFLLSKTVEVIIQEVNKTQSCRMNDLWISST